ncbi:MAG: L-lysine 6-transaminase [candidate division WOR-3 bacterium]
MNNKIYPKNVLETLSKYMLVDGFDLVFDAEKSHGSYLYDSKYNKEYLDFFTFFASSPIGFNHPKMNNDEFIKKIGKVSIHKPSNSDIYTIEMAEFVDTFGRIAKPDFMKYLFFVSGGALAVENALKTAFDWKIRKNLKKGKGEIGTKIIHFKHAFHGRSGYTLSMTNTFDPRKIKYFPKFDWPRVESPALTFPVTDEEIKRVEKEEEKIINEIKNIILKDGDDIAALIIEPIQAEGGDRHFRKEFFKKLRDITLESEIMFILDEVQTGMGLTGKFWCFEHFDIKPDIIAFGKKSQICGIMCSDRVDEVENHVFAESSRINSTWGGSLTDMVRATRILQIIDEEKLVENAKNVGEFLLDELKKIESKKISNIRGRGLMIAFDLENTEKRDKMFDKLFENGLFSIKCGEKSIRFRPPLNLSKDDALKGVKIVEKSLKEI